jgi:hypothetical protein
MVDDARYAYHIETVFEGAEEFVATIQHLPPSQQVLTFLASLVHKFKY